MTYKRAISYGSLQDQTGDLYLPDAGHGAVICLLHGGFWRMPYGREHIAQIAVDLAAHGFAVWNLEYRRVGASGGGWPGTLDDVGRGIDHLAALAAAGESLDLNDVTAVGHSAGGHLALWSGQHDPARSGGYGPKQVTVRRVVSLAPVADLVRGYELGCGNGAVRDFLGGSPDEVASRYRTTSPPEMLPLRIPQLIVHGVRDDTVPIELSRRYAVAARAAGDPVDVIELESAGHMDFVDPSSVAHAAVRRWLIA